MRARAASIEVQVTGTAGTAAHKGYPMVASAHPAPLPAPSRFERFLIRRWEYRHPDAWLTFRMLAGIWNAFLGILLLAYGFYWIALIPLAGSALIFWTAHRIWTKVHGG